MLCAWLLWGPVRTVWAQSEPLPGRYELAGGLFWTGPTPFDSRDASLTGPTGDRVRLFSTSTELARAAGLELRLGRRVTRAVQAEVSASYSTPVLTTSISNDLEGGAATVASESTRQVTVEASAVVDVGRGRVGSRVFPFVTGGGGYLRQLHEGDTLVQTGRIYHVGGGARIPLVTRGRNRRFKQLGVRADVRAILRTGGITFDGRAHVSPAVTASAFVRF